MITGSVSNDVLEDEIYMKEQIYLEDELSLDSPKLNLRQSTFKSK